MNLQGLAGDDVFVIAGGHPFTGGIFVNGGEPSASDTLNFTGSGAGAVTVDLTARTVQEAGFGPVGFVGVEHVNIDANNALTINGTAGDDSFSVQPTAVGNGNFTVSSSGALSSHPQFTYTDVSTFSVSGGGAGFDILEILGNEGADTVTSTATTVTRAGGTVAFDGTIDELHITTLGGRDDVALTSIAVVTIVDLGAGNDLARASGTTRLTLLGGAGDDALFGGGGGSPRRRRRRRRDGRRRRRRLRLWRRGLRHVCLESGRRRRLFEGDEGDDRLGFAGANGTDTYTIFGDNGRVIFQRQPGNVGINMGGVENIFANSETIEMSGRKKLPPNTTTSSGFANFTYNAATGLFDIRIFVTGLATADRRFAHPHEHSRLQRAGGRAVWHRLLRRLPADSRWT